MIKNVFITGKPGCGKTTLIMEILKELNLDAGGFYTSEIREDNIRKGFKITALDGKEGILAHINPVRCLLSNGVNIKSPYRVSKYKVNIKDLEEIGVKAILESLKKNKVTLVNEIGKMEMYSEKFKKAVLAALDSENKVLGAIKLTFDPFTDKIKRRRDTKIFYLTRENFQKIKGEIKKFLKNERRN